MAGVGIEKKPLWQIAAATDVGRMRAHNEDSYAVLRAAQLRGVYDFALLVADGMGGRNAGEVASRTAVEAASQAILNNVQHVDAPALLRFAVEAAHVAIQQRAEGNPEYEGMGTTLVIALAKDREIWIASVGDSRAYVLRGERLLPLTEDHTFVAEQVRVGGMTLEQARHSRFRHMLTRAVGTSSVDYTPDVVPARLQPGDMLLLCTDGLTSMVWEEEMVRLLRKYRHDPDRACQSLIDAANAQGGQDNITVLLAADMRDTVADEEADGELLTVSELPTERNPLRRAARLMRRISLKQVVLGAAALLVVAGAIMAISLLRKPKPIPQLPPPPPRLDLATVLYESPRILLNKPLRGAPLVIAPDGNLYVMSEQGRVLRLSSDGKILTASAQPFSAAADPELKPDMVYFAVDPQGNLYVCDRANRRIVKYRSDGTLIGSIGEGVLKRPAALAVGADGSVYVIDAGKLTLFRAIPGGNEDGAQPHR
ncbi:MAG: Stp1/IreP family PP2C-type Ser/Thr phosphatase [Armatimonadota bacterium]|nr:Stp1/IreP family PP2C-type Ser/Thr phosphatase [Armatimonadota bacterium]